MEDFRKHNLTKFAEWARQHVKGDEKGEAQIYLDRLFQACGQRGCLEVGGKPEFRIRKAREDGGGTAFADYVWKPVVLIEMKKRGEDLTRHYRQAFDYWTRLAPGRPRYVILCNFDEFWVYDFDSAQIDTPVDTVSLDELPGRYKPLAFLFPTGETPEFRNYHEAVTRKAADLLAECYRKLARRVDPALAQRFILQMLVALFAKDTGLLDPDLVRSLLDDCRKPSDSYDLLGGLFIAMNTRERVSGGRFRGVEYFNGGIFADPARIELHDDELNQLRNAVREDWSKVRPDIFGTLFEHSMGKEERHALGGHYTSPGDIMKIVEPTIARPWREQIESARTLDRLIALRERMRSYSVLDPACGSGNFLYLAYRELKRLEARLNERITEKDPRHFAGQAALGLVTARQFFGIDIVPFAVELAKVTMMIGRKLAIDELHVTEPALPLDNLDDNFLVADALMDDAARPRPWPKADAIIGNPPFLGSRFLAKERSYEYARKLYAAYPEVPKMADYCVYWFRRAADHLPACTVADPVAGRAGLVGTQNIRNNQSRVGGLDHVVKTGTIIEAVDNQPWSGEANVHVSIVDWVKTHDAALLPTTKKLWVKSTGGVLKLKKQDLSINPAARRFELASRNCAQISSSLSDLTDTSGAAILACNREPKLCYVGQYPFNEGFLLDPSEARALLQEDRRLSRVLFPYMIGRDLLADGRPSRWIIDFNRKDILEASGYGKAFQLVKKLVMPTVLAKAESERKATGRESTRWTRVAERWWQFRDYQPGTMRAIAAISRYIVCSRVTKRPVFAFLSRAIHPDNALMVFPLADDYSFGILQSNAHWQWFITKCSKLTERFRYTPESVFDTFPWPQDPSRRQVCAVAEAGREVRKTREKALEGTRGGLRALYRTLEIPGRNPLKDAHAALDAAVLDAYGFSPARDLLAQILLLNVGVAARIGTGDPVTPPGVPPSYGEPSALVTTDCIRP